MVYSGGGGCCCAREEAMLPVELLDEAELIVDATTGIDGING